MTTYNNATNAGNQTAHGITIAQGPPTTPNYLVLSAGQLPIGTTSSDPSGATLTQGTNVTITSASGSITIAQSAGGSGALTWIASVTASNSATVNFSNNLSSTYDNYLIVGENHVPATTATYLQGRVGTGATPTYQTTGYAGDVIYSSTGGVVGRSNSGTTTVDIGSSVDQQTNSSTYGGSLELYITNVNNASNYKNVQAHSAYPYTTTSDIVQTIIANQWQTATVLTSFQFFQSSGNLTTGTFKLYGIQN